MAVQEGENVPILVMSKKKSGGGAVRRAKALRLVGVQTMLILSCVLNT